LLVVAARSFDALVGDGDRIPWKIWVHVDGGVHPRGRVEKR
jgi:hypothetical protein